MHIQFFQLSTCIVAAKYFTSTATKLASTVLDTKMVYIDITRSFNLAHEGSESYFEAPRDCV